MHICVHRSGSSTLSVIHPQLYLSGMNQRLGHATLASDIDRIRSAVPGTSGISENDDDNDNDNDNDGTFVEQIRSQYI